jgi:predicted ATPase/DNA-binding winged helix-turn-helix (wHTH) protein
MPSPFRRARKDRVTADKSALRFRIFGGIRVEGDDGAPLRLGKKLQQLLGLLLLHANHDVSADLLAFHLWGDRQPADSLNSLQEAVARLRAVLGDARARRTVVTAKDGYRIVADPDSVDVSVFRRLATAGLAVHAAEPELARLFLAGAIECSRGELPDLADSSLAAEVSQLDRMRHAAEKALNRLAETPVPHGDIGAEQGRPGWSAGSKPVALFVRLDELPLLVLADLVNEVSRVGGEVSRLSGGLLVAPFPGVSAALHVASRLFELIPGDPEALLGGAVDQLVAGPESRALEQGVKLAARARVGEIIVTSGIQRAAAAARAVVRLDPAGDGQWRMGRCPVEGQRAGGRSPFLCPLVGRDADATAIASLIESSSLVTLRGSGGIGKTRLAFEVARRVAANYPDGVSVVDLADADRHGGLLPAIAGELGFVSEPYRPLFDTILDRLSDRHLLLVLDNCEAFLEEARRFADATAQECPKVTVLTTSRSALGAMNETTYEVDALTQPDAAILLDCLVSPRIRSGAVSDDIARRLHALLDGMPLAIECAASVARAFGLDAAVSLLGGLPDGAVLPAIDAAHGGLGRHRSIELALVASHGRLDADDAGLFERLSCLRGSWATDDAGAAVPDGTTIDLERSLGRLEEASLLRHEGPDRWRMLEPVRQFAATLLLRRGEQAVQAERHAWHFVRLAERAAVGLTGADEGEWFARLGAAHPNLAAALSWSVASGAAEPALRLTASVWWYWAATGRFLEGAAALERALALGGDVDPRLRARALVAAGHLSWWAGDPQRTRSASRLALDLIRTSDAGDPEVAWLDGWARVSFAAADMWRGRDRELLGDRACEAAMLFSTIGDEAARGIALEVHSGLAWHWGDDELAHTTGRQALDAFEASGHQTMIAQGRRVAGLTTALVGDVDTGRRLVEDGLTLSEHLGDIGGMPLGLCMLGLVELVDGRTDRAVAAFRRSLHLNREAGQIWPAVLALAFAGERAVVGGRAADGVRLLAASRLLTDRTGIGLAPRERDRVEEALDLATKLLGEAQVAEAGEQGRHLGTAAAMVLAIEVLESL